MHTFLGVSDSAVFHYMLCLFVSGLYWKTQVLSPVMICLRISLWKVSRLGIILHFLMAFLKTFVPFENFRPRHHNFTINLFKKLKTLSWGLLQFHQKLQVDSLFHSELLKARLQPFTVLFSFSVIFVCFIDAQIHSF